ncbi:hypothetical protein BpHYR1_025451 [Brachionus plicatilis]|uniref:Uncharacterized protein n=1 Tax=Brachionus plicatilis TaxID=10195 RepID=A0A3M7Q126_BRAPC|nr:hypothetical protein BpHYR1_025451 [Brachionus plicatilis]
MVDDGNQLLCSTNNQAILSIPESVESKDNLGLLSDQYKFIQTSAPDCNFRYQYRLSKKVIIGEFFYFEQQQRLMENIGYELMVGFSALFWLIWLSKILTK